MDLSISVNDESGDAREQHRFDLDIDFVIGNPGMDSWIGLVFAGSVVLVVYLLYHQHNQGFAVCMADREY